MPCPPAVCYSFSPTAPTQNPSNKTWSTKSALKVHVPPPAGQAPVACSAAWLVSCSCIKVATITSGWQEPKHLAGTTGPLTLIIPNQYCQQNVKFQVFSQCLSFCTHGSIAWWNDLRIHPGSGTPKDTSPSPAVSVNHFFFLLSRKLCFWNPFKTVVCLKFVTAYLILKAGSTEVILVTNNVLLQSLSTSFSDNLKKQFPLPFPVNLSFSVGPWNTSVTGCKNSDFASKREVVLVFLLQAYSIQDCLTGVQ